MKVTKNQKIKFITVLDEKIEVRDGIRYNLCRCECGNEVLIRNHTLRTQRIRDCGCGTYKLNQYIGTKFGKLTVSKCYKKRLYGKVNIICVCKCDCGNETEVVYSNLKNGNVSSCGCSKDFNFYNYRNKLFHGIEIIELLDEKEKTVKCKCHCGEFFVCNLYDLTAKSRYIQGCKKCKKDGESKASQFSWNIKTKRNRLMGIYYGMLDRCYNTLNKSYKDYGGRGIKICEEWLENPKSFYNWSIKNGYSKELTIERKDNNGNYTPQNCRWASLEEQANNRRNTLKFEVNGEMLTISQISNIFGINKHTLRTRLRKGMCINSAISVPIRKRGG